ncbi:hypothetical protein [Hymenobacter sp. 102]|uniref:hypothetical protein n=1 Tax=Hymenobacter sp. 102 TaxID=3403152 RepID=UPI003CF12DB4
MQEKILFKVLKSFSLTGLGVLLLPANPVPELQRFALHTALKVQLRFPGGHQISVVASVEEISRPHEPETRGLLLAQEELEPIPPDTAVWWTGQEAGWEDLF